MSLTKRRTSHMWQYLFTSEVHTRYVLQMCHVLMTTWLLKNVIWLFLLIYYNSNRTHPRPNLLSICKLAGLSLFMCFKYKIRTFNSIPQSWNPRTDSILLQGYHLITTLLDKLWNVGINRYTNQREENNDKGTHKADLEVKANIHEHVPVTLSTVFLNAYTKTDNIKVRNSDLSPSCYSITWYSSRLCL